MRLYLSRRLRTRVDSCQRLIALAAGLLLSAAPLPAPTAVAAPSDDVIGELGVQAAVEEDTLPDIALDHDLGYIEIVAANQSVDPWLPGAGTRVVLPTAHLLPAAPRRGIVINLPEQRLYYFPPKGPPQTYPIGVPAEGTDLRVGTTRIIAKRPNPTWFPTASERAEDPELPDAVPPGPENPLGDFALYTAWTSIVIHGTNRPYGIGRRVSHGCFRLYPDDIETLYKQVPVGTEVTVVDQPAKLGWIGNQLYLEIHPTLEQADELIDSGKFTPAPIPDLDRLVLDAVGSLDDRIDWRRIDQAERERTGVPIAILK